MSRVALLLPLLLLTLPALAERLPSGHDVPSDVGLFTRARLISAVGKSTRGCNHAVQAAMTELDVELRDQGLDRIVAVWSQGTRSGWTPGEAVECKDKGGKKQVVRVQALAVEEGSGAAFPHVAGSRILEILDATVGDAAMMPNQLLAGHGFVSFQERLYLRRPTHGVKDPVHGSPSERAVKAFHQSLVPSLSSTVTVLADVPEAYGVELRLTHTRKVGDRNETERFIYRLPASAVRGIVDGALSPQEALQRGAVLRSGKGVSTPIRLEI